MHLSRKTINEPCSIRHRMPLFMLAFICLGFGIYSGLLRLGYFPPWQLAEIATSHAALMVSGFLGTVIALERAVAIGKRWSYLAPLCAALGGISFIVGFTTVGVILTTIASIVLNIATLLIFIRQRELFTFTLLLGSLAWLFGNAFWLSGFNAVQLTPWWVNFLVLTIAGERLELSRMLPTSSTGLLSFKLILVLLSIGALIATLGATINFQSLSVGLFALSLWLLRQDIARLTIKQNGLTRYIAVCLLAGYCWLFTAGLIGLLAQALIPGSTYDAFLHSILVGFVFSMIFGHAPIIFPAVVKLNVIYHPAFYLPLITLHFALIVRVAGDILLNPFWRSVGGGLNAIAILLFVISMMGAIIAGRRNDSVIKQN